ncbi:MAG: tetratricopeptide repeat protein [Planctomycetes bacterium]|nr:tetratricopeptide repeat protein [Planctomycetota bacterium]
MTKALSNVGTFLAGITAAVTHITATAKVEHLIANFDPKQLPGALLVLSFAAGWVGFEKLAHKLKKESHKQESDRLDDHLKYVHHDLRLLVRALSGESEEGLPKEVNLELIRQMSAAVRAGQEGKDPASALSTGAMETLSAWLDRQRIDFTESLKPLMAASVRMEAKQDQSLAKQDDALAILLRMEQNYAQTADKDSIIKNLQASLERLQNEADAGNTEARKALDEARTSGDGALVQSALISLADRHDQKIRDVAGEFVELCREISAIAYLRGDIDEAKKRLESILRFLPDDLDAINHLGLVARLRGDLVEAETRFQRVSDLATDEKWRTIAYRNLGLIYLTRGDLDRAEEMIRKSLAIDEKLGRLEGMAAVYGSLGAISQTRGDLDCAEEMYRKSLAINEKLGHLDGMASNYGNLGALYQTRGDLDRAEEMHCKSLAIHEKRGHLEGIAVNYFNRGAISQTRGDLDRAEEMYRKSHAIDEKLGRLEGMAAVYGNLGRIYQTRGKLDRAEEMHRKSLAINEKLGRLEGMADQYGNLDLIYRTRGDLDRAEEMICKSLAIDEKLGRLEVMANAYDKLGLIYLRRGDEPKAREFLTKSRDHYAKIGMKPESAQVQGWLDELSQLPPNPSAPGR